MRDQVSIWMTISLDVLHKITIIVWKNELHPFECSILKLNLIFCCRADIYFHNYPAYITVDFPWTVHCLKLWDYGRHFLYLPNICTSSLKIRSNLLKLCSYSTTLWSKMTMQPCPAHLRDSIQRKKLSVGERKMKWNIWQLKQPICCETATFVGKENLLYLCRSSHTGWEDLHLPDHTVEVNTHFCAGLYVLKLSLPVLLKPLWEDTVQHPGVLCSFQHFAWWLRKLSHPRPQKSIIRCILCQLFSHSR